MAEGFEPFHVPQQSRRDKLRVSNPPPPPGCVDYQSCAPLYDYPSDFIPCSANVHHTPVKAESHLPMMPFFGGGAGSMPFADPQMSVHLNPSSAAPYGYPSPAAQSLSLSLSSHHQKYDFFSGGGSPIELPPSKSAVPLGPFTGYASVLKGSRFLGPAHQLLEELCDMGRVMYADRTGPDPDLLDPPPLLHDLGDDCAEQSRKKSRLLSMLDEVYKRYKQYYQQMQSAIAAFESVAGLTSAAPFANSALNSMSKHFTCLKNAITDQLHHFASTSKLNRDRSSFPGGPPPGFIDQPVWRPQRGLPEHAVAVLRSWLFEHFLHPYPTDTDKLMLAKQTGLSRNQVSNWFINARVRLWKPMVEEIHTLETRQTRKVDEQPPAIECDQNNNASTSSIQRGRSEYHPSKRTRESPRENRGYVMKPPYEHLLPVTVGGVSLTLGLHQNGMGLSDSYPVNAARRFGLDPDDRDEYAVSGFDSQNHRQFGRDQHHHHIMEGQIMHDFVG